MSDTNTPDVLSAEHKILTLVLEHSGLLEFPSLQPTLDYFTDGTYRQIFDLLRRARQDPYPPPPDAVAAYEQAVEYMRFHYARRELECWCDVANGIRHKAATALDLSPTGANTTAEMLAALDEIGEIIARHEATYEAAAEDRIIAHWGHTDPSDSSSPLRGAPF